MCFEVFVGMLFPCSNALIYNSALSWLDLRLKTGSTSRDVPNYGINKDSEWAWTEEKTAAESSTTEDPIIPSGPWDKINNSVKNIIHHLQILDKMPLYWCGCRSKDGGWHEENVSECSQLKTLSSSVLLEIPDRCAGCWFSTCHLHHQRSMDHLAHWCCWVWTAFKV